VLGNPAQDKQVRQHVDDIDRLQPSGDPNGQALVGELVDDGEPPDLASVMGALLEKIVGPDLVGALGAQPDARSVSRARLGCRTGTLSPSRRQIRSTRLSLTGQPARRNNSAILR
jgi:hypothetical protein